MSRFYTAQFTSVAVAAQQDLLSLVAGSACGFRVHELGLSQSTDVSDANEKEWSLVFKAGATTAGSGGTTPTPVPNDFGDAAATATAHANDTTIATAGTIVTHYTWNWNVRVPFQYIWTPETRPVMRVSRRCVFGLLTTPSASTTCSGYIVFEELG
jgi:hypothetical protein